MARKSQGKQAVAASTAAPVKRTAIETTGSSGPATTPVDDEDTNMEVDHQLDIDGRSFCSSNYGLYPNEVQVKHQTLPLPHPRANRPRPWMMRMMMVLSSWARA